MVAEPRDAPAEAVVEVVAPDAAVEVVAVVEPLAALPARCER